MSYTATSADDLQAVPQLSATLEAQLVAFVRPILEALNQQLDVRLVRTFLATLCAILSWRHRAHGLLLSELGAYLAGPAHAPAGTKRLSNLLRAPAWAPALLHQWLWARARTELQTLETGGHTPLAIWDESVIEKPERIQNLDRCAVRSSKALLYATDRASDPGRRIALARRAAHQPQDRADGRRNDLVDDPRPAGHHPDGHSYPDAHPLRNDVAASGGASLRPGLCQWTVGRDIPGAAFARGVALEKGTAPDRSVG